MKLKLYQSQTRDFQSVAVAAAAAAVAAAAAAAVSLPPLSKVIARGGKKPLDDSE